MAASATVNITISVTGLPAGTETIAPTAITSATAVGQIQTVNLTASTFFAFSVPSIPNAPTGVLIIPPSGNTVTLTLKGVTGDTGIALSLTGWSYISLAGGGGALGILPGAGAVNGLQLVWI